MDKREALDLVRRFSALVQRVFNPVRIVLYGSYATGSQTASSDIDDRIELVLIEIGDDKSGFLESVLSRGETVYER